MGEIKRMIEIISIKCDECGSIYERDTPLESCFICKNEMCPSCSKSLGRIELCKEHYKAVWKFIKELKEQLSINSEQKEG